MLMRTLTPDDAPAFQALRLRGLQECPQAFSSSFEEEVVTPLAEIELRLQPKPDSAIFGAFRAGVLVALVGIQKEGMAKLAHKAFVWGVYVAPEARSVGIGAQLLGHALRHAAEVLAVRQVNLGVNTQNTAAIALYKKLGFVQYGLERGFLIVDGALHDEYHMVCLMQACRPQQASMALELRKAQPHDFPALQQMLELYQYELSDLWPQEADAEARYGYDLEPHRRGERFHAHVAMAGSQYLGFALVAPAAVTRSEGHWMEQFFILKRARRSGAGRALAEHVLRSHPGAWEVGQMPANLAAQAFWRRVIGQLTAGRYVELRVTEGWWQGWVQQFDVPAAG